MEVIIQPTPADAVRIAANLIAKAIRRKPNLVLGLATGGTPVQLYAELARMHREDGLDLSRVHTFNLDEYLGLPPNHPASYRRFMKENFFDHTNIDPRRTFVPDGMTPDISRHCGEYEELIKSIAHT